MYRGQKNFKILKCWALVNPVCGLHHFFWSFFFFFFKAYPRKYLSNGISHVVCWFMVTDLEKLGISLGANKGLISQVEQHF